MIKNCIQDESLPAVSVVKGTDNNSGQVVFTGGGRLQQATQLVVLVPHLVSVVCRQNLATLAQVREHELGVEGKGVRSPLAALESTLGRLHGSRVAAPVPYIQETILRVTWFSFWAWLHLNETTTAEQNKFWFQNLATTSGGSCYSYCQLGWVVPILRRKMCPLFS